MRRHALGVIALALVVLSFVLPRGPDEDPAITDLQAASLRIGLVCAMGWLAWHQLKRVPVWLMFTFPAVIAAVLLRRVQVLLILVPVLLAVAILRPRSKPSRRS